MSWKKGWSLSMTHNFQWKQEKITIQFEIQCFERQSGLKRRGQEPMLHVNISYMT
jgi:hypothetical protein